MISFISVLPALFTIFAAGFGVSTLLLHDGKRVPFSELAALSWLLGTAIVSLSIWLLAMLLRGIALQLAVAAICVALFVFGMAHWRKNKIAARVPWPRNWLESFLALILGLEIALVLLLTFKYTLGWDGLLIWELKARYAYLNGGALPAAYFADTTRAFSHPEYPLFLPLLETWLYFWMGDCDQYWLKLIFPIFYAVGMLLLAQAGAAWSGKRWIGLLVANLFVFIPFLTRIKGGIVLGYADVPLSIFYLAAFFYLLAFLRENSTRTMSIFVIVAAVLPWIKREGIILWFVLAICGAFFIARRRGILTAALSLVPGLAMIASWWLFLQAMHALPAHDFLPVNLSLVTANFYRLGPILASLLNEITTFSHWSLFWFAVAIAFVCLAFRDRSQRTVLLVICSIGPLAFYCGIYLFSAWPDYLHHVRSSLPRLLLHVAPLSILSIALALRPSNLPAEP